MKKTQNATVVALGLGRVGAVAELPANDSVRGMLFKVRHLVEVESA
jgi:large subunit ribosomal protein L30